MPRNLFHGDHEGQASLEMTAAVIGALLLLVGCLQVFVWINQRMVARQQSYEATRLPAASTAPGTRWDEPSERLEIFQ